MLAVFVIVAFYAKPRPLPLLLGVLGGALIAGAIAFVALFSSGWH